MPPNILSAYPGLDFDDIRRQVDGRSLGKECLELVSGIPRDVIDAASFTTRAIAAQQAIVDATAVAACPPWAEDALSAFGPQIDVSALSGAAPSRQLEAAAGYAEHAGLAGRLAQEWANIAPPSAMLGYQGDLESLRSVIDKPHREALSTIEALRQQIAAPYEQTADQIAGAYAAGCTAEVYAKVQSQLSDLANEHARAIQHLAGSIASGAAQHAQQNPLADYARQLREQWSWLDVDAVARTAGAFGVDVNEHFSTLAAAHSAWDSSSLGAAGLNAMQGMAIQLLRAPLTPPRAEGRRKKARAAKGQAPLKAAPPTADAPASDQRTLEEQRADSGLFVKESTQRSTQDALQELLTISLDLRARILRVAQRMTVQAFMHSDETPFLKLGAEIAAITLEFHHFDPLGAMDVLATWRQIIEWDGVLSAAVGNLRFGGSESINEDDVQHVRALMIQLHFLLFLFESMQNKAQ